MNKELAEEIRDQLAIEAHEIIHLVVKISERLNAMSTILEPKDTRPINVSKTAIVHALWEQNADRSREEVETALDERIQVNPMDVMGMPSIEEKNDEPCSTDYQYWEQLYNQSLLTNKALQEEAEASNFMLQEVQKVLADHIN